MRPYLHHLIEQLNAVFVCQKSRTLLAWLKCLIGKLLTPVCSSSLSSSLELGSIILTRECVYLTAANSNLYALICKSKRTNKQKEGREKKIEPHTHRHYKPIPLCLVVVVVVFVACSVCVCVLVTDILLSSFAQLNHHKHIEFTLRSIVYLTILMRYELAEWSSSIQFSLTNDFLLFYVVLQRVFLFLFSQVIFFFFLFRLQSWSPQLDFSLMTQIFSIKNIYCFLWF